LNFAICFSSAATVSSSMTSVAASDVLDDDTVAELEKQIAKFKSEFRTSDGKALNEQFDALDEAEIQQEQLVVKK